MNRADHTTLVSLGLGEADMRTMGLWELPAAQPSQLVDAYLRRSNKKEDLATLRGHLRDIVRWAAAEGVLIRHVWFEQLSASKSYVRRHEFEKATQAVLDGESKTLAVWKTDRFDRRGMGAVGRMLDEFDMRRARLVSVSEGLDSSKGGRMVFAILSERAREEAKDIALRVKIGHDSHKAENRRGTGKPPFGLFSKRGSGTVEPHWTEFAAARRIAELVLSGMPTEPTAHTVNAEGIRTRGGHTFTGAAVSKLVQSPLFAGMVPQRERNVDDYGNPLGTWKGYGEPALDERGQPRLCGTGVVTPAEWYRMRALIRERTSEDRQKGKPGAKYLGTSVYHCGRLGEADALCLAPMAHRGGRYRCQARQTRGESVCLGVTTLASRIDFAVGQAWQRHVTALEPSDPVLMTIGRRWLAFSDPETQARKEGAMSALAAAQGRVQRLEDDYYLHGKLTEERYEELAAGQRATIETMSATLEALDRATDLSPLLDGDTLAESWEAASVPDRRMLLRCALGAHGVTVGPAARQGDTSPIEGRLAYDWISQG